MEASKMTNSAIRFVKQLAVVATCTWAASASAQVPVPSANTPTLRGGTPLVGSAVSGEIGYAALRAGLYFGRTGDRDVGVEFAAPTFGDDALPGWNQTLGMDLRVPLRFKIVQWPKATGSIKVGPYFHTGRVCPRNYAGCGLRSVGIGPVFGFITDIALPKVFKLIVGIEQQMGLLHFGSSENNNYKDNFFAAQTFIDLGIEAFWRDAIFFTMIANVGAQYGSDQLYDNNHALYRHMFGAGYKWK
jgi:hypothetical protein